MSRPLLLRTLLLGAMATFVLCMARAHWLYPGGTWCARSDVGLDFWRTFFCDLTHHHSLNGSDNPAAPWARAGMIAFTLGLGPFWPLAADYVAEVRARRALLTAGLMAVAGALAVPFVPSDRFGAWHGVVVIATAVPAFTALALAATGALSRAPRRVGLAAALALALALADMALYLRSYFGLGESCLALPAAQKLAATCLVAWFVLTAVTPKNTRPVTEP